jgi:hypothetical protein
VANLPETNTNIELCAKSAPIKEQLQNRAEWSPRKVEVLLRGPRDLPILSEILNFTSVNFKTFNVEVGYALDEFTPTDLTHSLSQDYILRVAEVCKKYKNFERLIMHMVGNCVVANKDSGYRVAKEKMSVKEQALEQARKFIKKVDPDKNFITLENVYPIDANNDHIALYPCGKVSEDFIGLPRVVDTAHLGISAQTYMEALEDEQNGLYGIYHINSAEAVPVYLGKKDSQERIFGLQAKLQGLTEAVITQMLYNTSNIFEIHLCGNFNYMRNQQDGAGFEDDSAIDLKRIFSVIRATKNFPKKLIVIPEIKELDANYVQAPRQRKMFKQLEQYLQQEQVEIKIPASV